MKKRIFIFFLYLAGTILLTLAIVPHHHHSNSLCFSVSHCHHQHSSDDSKSADHQHDVANNDSCIIKQTFNIPANDFKLLIERPLQLFKALNLLVIQLVEDFATLHRSNLANVQQFEYKPPLLLNYNCFVNHTTGLRAPPMHTTVV